jgi:cytochrome o ubiquinol oxidase operon protein cyoD
MDFYIYNCVSYGRDKMKRITSSTHRTVASLTMGFILSVLLTLSAYFVVVQHLVPDAFILIVIIILAFMQFIVQLVFFLHLDKETGARWNLIIFLSTVSVVLIVVVGSLWIMYHLNYNMDPMMNMDKSMYLINQQ